MKVISGNPVANTISTLSTYYTGGTLAVRRAGNEILFDWSERSATTIQWAAFYGDCEHEVLEVTARHRLTLTYNLCAIHGLGHLADRASTSGLLDCTTLPVYQEMNAMLLNPNFAAEGCVLGIYLQHAYAHTSQTLNFFPSSLKGADMVMYEIARSLGLSCFLCPALESEGRWDKVVSLYVRDDFRVHCDKLWEMDEGQGIDTQLKGQGWMGRDEVIWLNSSDEKLKDPNVAYITYGNDAQVGIMYSSAALLIHIPRFDEETGQRSYETVSQQNEGVNSAPFEP